MPAPGTLPRHFPHPMSPAGRVDPLPSYRWLVEHAPVYADSVTGMWLLAGHAACEAALRDPRFSAAAGQRGRTRADPLPVSMLTTDPPDHHRLRGPGALLLGPAALNSIVPMLERDIDALLDGLRGPVDAGTAIGGPLTTAVYSRLFGIADEQQGVFAALAEAAAVNLDPRADAATAAAGRLAMTALRDFLDQHAQSASPCPLRRLFEEAPLERGEILGILGLAVVGGWQPLTDFVGNALHTLLPRPAAVRALVGADESTARLAVDELLRLQAPVPFTARVAMADVALPGGTVSAGAMALVLVAAANRDPAVFDAPDEAVFDRTPNQHLAFGSGPHFCLAAPLVRAVGARLLPRLAACSPRLADPTVALAWDPSPTMHRLVACPIVLGPG